MKKHLLLGLAMGIGGFAMAQSSMHPVAATGPAKLKPSVANRTDLYKKNQLPGAEAGSFASIVNSIKPAQPVNQPNRAYTTTIIGTTGYQLQTNASVCNRFVKSSDGTMSATWTFSTQSASWTDRGTGYNYYNGASWGANPTVRIENVRTGFTNIGVTGTGAEVVVSHEATDIHVASRATKGTGTWSNQTLGYPDVWSRMAIGGAAGNTIHIISQTTGVGNPPFMGQDGAISYSRSQDGGVTWDKIQTVIPQIDAASYLGFGGDSYAIDAKGDTIVIVAGGFDVDVVMIKSIDNGDNWTKTIVHQFAIPLFDEPTMLSDTTSDGIADTLETNDASLAVLLDNQGKAHVWYGRMRMLNDDLGDAGVSYFPGTDGLAYWNESMSAPMTIAYAADIDMDGILTVADWGTYQTSLCSHPSGGIDAAGNIYVSYAGIYEGNAENGAPGDGKSYRHTYVMRSEDGGATWCPAQDVSDPPGPTQQDYVEGVYGAMAKDVDGFVHLIIQTDNAVGHGVSTATTPDPQSGDANILYTKVPVADLATCLPAGINENTGAVCFGLYPNPAASSTNLAFTVATKGNVSIKVYNVTGKMVAELTNQDYAAGKFNLTVDLSNYTAGIYMVNMITADGRTVTQKMIVK